MPKILLVNVFRGIHRNPLFCGILFITAVLQVVMVEFGAQAMHVAEDGLSAKYWGISIAFGFVSLPVQQVINILYHWGDSLLCLHDMRKRVKSSRRLSTRNIDAGNDLRDNISNASS